MNQESISPRESAPWKAAAACSILGWTLDAFDFFVVIFLVDTLATHFHVAKSAIVWTLTASLATRPLGAFIFGALADRFGRRKPLMAVVLYFSSITVLSGLAPTYGVFLVLRAFYGIGMGGYWGVGASLAMESAPPKRRGFLSGLMQAGYPAGYLFAALGVLLLIPQFGWRSLFFAGIAPALLTVYLASKSVEPRAWHEHRLPDFRSILRLSLEHCRIFLYLAIVMTVMICLSHGTQDLYPDFLKTEGGLTSRVSSMIALFYSVGGILGAIFFGSLSQRIGRRRCITLALILSFASIPGWAFTHSAMMLAAGAFLMQVGVQGAWGVIPAHLIELSPDAVRGLFPGFVYQLGVLAGSPAVVIEYALRDKLGYRWALALFEGLVIVSLVLLFTFGPEKHGKSFLKTSG